MSWEPRAQLGCVVLSLSETTAAQTQQCGCYSYRLLQFDSTRVRGDEILANVQDWIG